MNTYNSHTSGIGFGSPDLNLTVLDIKGWVMCFPTTEKDTRQENVYDKFYSTNFTKFY